MAFPFFERYLYVASAGFAAMVAAGFTGVIAAAARPPEMRRALALPACVVAVVLVVALGLRAHARSLDWHSSVRLFEQAVRAYPESPTLQFNLGEALQRKGRHQEAIAAYERTLELRPDLTMARVNAAIAHYGLGETDRAEQILRDVLDEDPQDCQALDALGTVLVLRDDLEGALPFYSAAFHLSGRNALFGNNLGLLLRDLRIRAEDLFLAGQYDEVLRLADRVLMEVPTTAWAFEVRGLILDDRGAEEEAFKSLYTAVQLSKDSLVAASRLAKIYRRHGQEAEALEMDLYIEEARRRIPESMLQQLDDQGAKR
jgi:tetratricopeptide (TPR) repeat protein